MKWTEMEKLDDIFPKSKSVDYLQTCLEKRLGPPQSYEETNLVLQLGSNDPNRLKICVEHAVQSYSFREINLNCGCPAIESGGASTYGASLMKQPELTGSLVDAVKRGLAAGVSSKSDRPNISVKCRIGVFEDAGQMRPLEAEDYDFLKHYITTIHDAGANHVVLHARPAILSGLSPVKNRIIPTLDYDFVRRIAAEFESKVDITLNGGITSLTQLKSLRADKSSPISSHMAGRWSLQRPLDLARVEELLKDNSSTLLIETNAITTALENYIDYALTMATLPSHKQRFTSADLCLPLYLAVEQLKDDWDCDEGEKEDPPVLSYDEIESLFDVIKGGITQLQDCYTKGNKKVMDSNNVYKQLSSSFKSLAGTKVVNKWKRNRAEL
jgi:tRNA dihydrouridine synthase A